MAIGLQKKFDWSGVAAAAVGVGVGNAVGGLLGGVDFGFGGAVNADIARSVSGMAGAIANAATRTLIKGTDFGDILRHGTDSQCRGDPRVRLRFRFTRDFAEIYFGGGEKITFSPWGNLSPKGF